MAKVIPLRQALIGWTVTIASVVWLLFAGRWSDALVHSSHRSASTGWLAVGLAVLSVVPWIYCIAWAVAAADEYVRHIVLVGTALAFLIDLLAHIALNVMVDAQILPRDLYPPELVSAMASWVVSCGIAILYYRQRP